MFRELYLTVLFCTVCFAVPIISDLHSINDNNEMENIRVKRYGFPGDYNPYVPYTYKFKTPLFKIKIKSGHQNNLGYMPSYGYGNPAGFHPSNGAFHPGFNSPYGYHQNPFGYGWQG
ncbi:unnamed protein product [Cercopithifilaria johnstoni]|uniref:Prisilkin-39-like n=1 Tax=Cercopithifilaria johnstoni TaxID=2874296 RepID=A0A8J2Q650_9BILA|nr:unnamed protein product [Cercopithifilaria johnstoni]